MTDIERMNTFATNIANQRNDALNQVAALLAENMDLRGQLEAAKAAHAKVAASSAEPAEQPA